MRRDISVVIPTHNRRPMLEEAIASALDQRGVEASVLVVDDDSADDTFDWLGRLQRPQVSHRLQRPGRGGSAARNVALADVDTPYVMFLDDDDVLRPGALAALAAALDRHPPASGAAGAWVRFGAAGASDPPITPRRIVCAPVWRELLLGWNMPPSALLWRTSSVRAIGGWDESLRRCEDRDVNLRAYPRPFVVLPEAVMDYRVHAGQQPGREHAALNEEMLARFVAGLPDEHRPSGRAILIAKADLESAMVAYRREDHRAAAAKVIKVLRADPDLRRSPIVGPWLRSMALRTTALALLPTGAATAVRTRARRWRHERSPEKDSVAPGAS